ncbi:MAG: glycosyltransferase, partial [Methylobacteriaceae bacterium]|nr:glycosyltransferase [Methylobacteriaceae bacterium]
YVGSLPRDSFSETRLIGPAVELLGFASLPALTAMADRRGLATTFDSLPRGELLARYATAPWYLVLPSRRDTFNLACLEALLSGCPVAISASTGASDFLKRQLPDLPCVHLDPDRLYASDDALLADLASYGRSRRQLRQALEAVDPQPTGPGLAAIWGERPETDEDLRSSLGDLAHELVEQVSGLARRKIAKPAHEQFSARIDSIFQSRSTPESGSEPEDRRRSAARQNEFVALLKQLPSQVAHLDEISRDLDVRTGRWLALADSELNQVTATLAPLVFSANRVSLFDLMAEIEERRGNDLLYATYKIRSLRLSGRRLPEDAERVARVLAGQGFRREADAVRWLHGAEEDVASARSYLDQTRTAFHRPPSGDIASVLDRRTPEQPRVSIIVSMYRAAEKLPAFLRGLSRLTERSRRSCELVLIDSFSPDDTQEVVVRELDALAQEGRPLSALCIRTGLRETIQGAWNRGITAARGEYLAFLGVDEMNRPDAFDLMVDHLDSHPEVDWVQGTAVVTDVTASGSFLNDTMAYDRRFDSDVVQLLDTCFLGYVGALYRKSIHDRVGYYDSSFRGAGDTEFKNRALPYMRVETLPTCLGFFLNYPEERVTASAAVEIEDIRAWYLHRSAAGVAYQFDSDHARAVALFHKCLSYKKTYLDQVSTDLELASIIHRYLRDVRSEYIAEISEAATYVNQALQAYRSLDDLAPVKHRAMGLEADARIARRIEAVAIQLQATRNLLATSGWSGDLTFTNDNRSHQHFGLWPSTLSNETVTSRPHVPVLVEVSGKEAAAKVGPGFVVSPALTFDIQLEAAEVAKRGLICKVDGVALPSTLRENGSVAFTRRGSTRQGASWSPALEIVDELGATVRDVSGQLIVDLVGVTDAVTGDRPLGLHNLHYVETNEEGEPSHRWSGPGSEARITVPVACTSEGQLDINVIHPGVNAFEDVTLVVDGHRIPMSPGRPGWRSPGHLSVTLPERRIPSGLQVGLVTPQLSSSRADEREIGVAISRLTITYPLSVLLQVISLQ